MKRRFGTSIRLTQEMHDQITALAKARHRTTTGEIVLAIEQHLALHTSRVTPQPVMLPSVWVSSPHTNTTTNSELLRRGVTILGDAWDQAHVMTSPEQSDQPE